MSTELTTTKESAVSLRMDCPLVSTSHLKTISDADLAIVARAFPGEISDADRTVKARTMVAQFALYIDNLDNSAKVLGCVTQSIAECMLTLAALDIPLIKSLGYAALIPYGKTCTVSIMYQGLCELIYRTGAVASIQCGLVYKGDTFEYELGTNPALRCIRGDGAASEANVTHAWAIAHNNSGPDTIEVMERDELLKVKKASKMQDGQIWRTWWGQMMRKSPIRRLAKYMQTAVGGIAQSQLARGLEIENSQYDPSRAARYEELGSAHAREQLEVALKSSDRPLALPEPLPERPAGWIEGLGKTKVDLWNKVQKIREAESDLSCKDWMEDVLRQLNQAGTISSCEKLDNPDDIEAVWDAVVNENRFDLATGDLLPDFGEGE